MADSDFVEDIRRVVNDRVGRRGAELPAPPVRPAIGAAEASNRDAGGTGIVSPLTEISRKTKEIDITDPTGAFTITVEAITQVVMEDANGRRITFNFA